MKKVITGICSVVAAGAILAGATFASASVTKKNSIGSDKALEIALTDAGIQKEKATGTKSEFDKDNGRYIFDVDFISDGKEYDYKIDAKSGEIIERDVDKDDSTVVKTTDKAESTTTADSTTNKETTKAETSNSQTKRISLDKAKKIALDNAGITSSKAKFTKAKLEKDDGKYEYDIEFTSGNKSYDYTLDAYSGKILEKEIETLKKVSTASTTVSNSQTKYISLDEAKKIALDNAGIDSSKAKFTKAKLEKDDGDYEYDIEFISGNKSYDYTLDAYSGKVLEKEVETLKKSSIGTTADLSSQNGSKISLTEAKNIAISDAKVKSSNVKFTKAEYDNEDRDFEIEFVSDDKEYKYEIGASGTIIDKKVKTVKDTALHTSALISTDKARSIALDHAGLKLSEVKMKKVHLEKDDGVYEYEVEFVKGYVEYEYCINAKTGAIIEAEKDFVD